MIGLGLLGADGRMGQAVDRLAAAADDVEVVARVSAEAPDYASLAQCDGVIDFSSESAIVHALPHLKDGCAFVSGTTGLSTGVRKRIKKASARLAVLQSGNFSLGINLLMRLAYQAADSLSDDWDIEILEMHHRDKVDAPSGTALMLGEAVADGRDVMLDMVASYDRKCARGRGDIGFAVLRGGGVYGDHEVRLVSNSEMITLGHSALNRDVFADGALSALRWAVGKPAGLYSMDDVLGG